MSDPIKLTRATAEVEIISRLVKLFPIVEKLEEVDSYDQDWYQLVVQRDRILHPLIEAVEEALNSGLDLDECVHGLTKQMYNMVAEKGIQTSIRDLKAALRGETCLGELPPSHREPCKKEIEHQEQILANS